MPSFVWILLIHAVFLMVLALAHNRQQRHKSERARRDHEAAVFRVDSR